MTALEGYIESRDLQSGSRRSADLTVRIPADRADDFVRQVTEASNVTSSSETVENITLTYVATQPDFRPGNRGKAAAGVDGPGGNRV